MAKPEVSDHVVLPSTYVQLAFLVDPFMTGSVLGGSQERKTVSVMSQLSAFTHQEALCTAHPFLQLLKTIEVASFT